ncbi:hypothetical protein KJ909_00735 [Patescibacteria group bacterium]|nr:hypothetical protein [Patescibacteria group bacterium]
MPPLSQGLFAQAKKFVSPKQMALLNDVATIIANLKGNSISDYSFIVAPAAKAYEGYLKYFFLKIGLIDQYQYQSDRFRIGKTLNPSLRFKRFSIFQKLIDLDDSGEELAELLWDGWKFGRNQIFHYFPNKLKRLSLSEAKNRIALILNAIIKSHQFLARVQPKY